MNLADELPVAARLTSIVAASRDGSVVVTAPPGSGKTTLVPAAILDDLAALGQPGRVLLVQPRRLAARAVARQIARLRGSAVGGEVGYAVRFDSRVGPDTRLVVETTGVTLRRLDDDPYLEGIGAVVLDEFHERSLELDLVFGLLVRLRCGPRPDLRVAVMSATLDTAPVARALGGCPVVATAGRIFPVEVRYEKPGERADLETLVRRRVASGLEATPGHVLVFLPGVGEIGRCERALAASVRDAGHDLVCLSGDLPPERQDAALAETGRRRVVLATNIAETSLTIPGVTAVVDSGLARRPAIDSSTGLPRLEMVRISRGSADQRAGRAGRTGPGVCYRLWDEPGHHGREPLDPPEVLRGDLTAALLRLAVEQEPLTGDAGGFRWLDQPPPAAIARDREILQRLGGLDPLGRATPLGRELARLPAHPRLARLLVAGAAAGALREAAVAAALLSDRDPFRRADRGGGPRDREHVRSRSDIVDRVLAIQAFHAGAGPGDLALEFHPGAAREICIAAEQFGRLVETPRGIRAADPAAALARALLSAYPDRLVRLRPGSRDRGTMVGGRGVRLDPASRVRDEPFFLALDVDDAASEVKVRLASAVERAWLDDDGGNLAHREEILFAPARRQVEARRHTLWLDLVIDETPVAITDPDRAAAVLAAAALREPSRWLPPANSAAGSLLARSRWLAFALPELGLPPLDDCALGGLFEAVCRGLRGLDEIPGADWWAPLVARLGPGRVAEIDSLAPARLSVGGRSVPLSYEPDPQAPGRPPVLAVRIQDLFGVRETPRVAGGRVRVLLQLLGPNNRPQQVTDDLPSFWATTYPAIRRELARRYPKHSWPQDPGSSS